MRTIALNIFKAVLTRLLFAAHAMVAIFWVTVITGDSRMWNLAWILATLLIETVLSIIYRRGDEYKWVSGSIICYLATTIPCTWITEFHLLYQRTRMKQETRNKGMTFTHNTTVPTASTTINLPMNISLDNFTDLIEQSTMLMLILGRWLLPKGSLSRESLSQLLLVNLAMSADIIEFFDILKLSKTRVSKDLTLTILSLWTISLLQFPLNATAKLGNEIESDVSPSGISKVSNQDINKNSIPNYIKRHGRKHSRVSVDYSVRQAPLSDRKLSIIAPQSRRLSVQQTSAKEPECDEGVMERQVTMPRTHRHSMAVGVIDRLSIPDAASHDLGRQPRRLSMDVNRARQNNLGQNIQGLANQMPRRYSRASVDHSADRMTAQLNFERKPSLTSNETTAAEEEGPKHRVTMDLIGTLMALFLQDGPFLTFRLYMIAKHSAFEYMIVFLTVKNALLLTLQVYKLCVQHCVCHDHKDNDFSPENHIDAMSRLNNVQIAVIHEETEASKAEPTNKKRRGRYNRLSVRWSRTKASIRGTGSLFYSRA